MKLKSLFLLLPVFILFFALAPTQSLFAQDEDAAAQDDGSATGDEATTDDGTSTEDATPNIAPVASPNIAPQDLTNVNTSTAGYNQFRLTTDQQNRLTAYTSLRGSAFIDEIVPSAARDSNYQFSPGDAAYETFIILRSLGLNESLSGSVQFLITKAFFANIPRDNPDGRILRNVIIPNWFDNGKPLIIGVTTSSPLGSYQAPNSPYANNLSANQQAYSSAYAPSFASRRVTLLTNVDKSVLARSSRAAKKAGPIMDYPLYGIAATIDINILPTGVLSSSSVTKSLVRLGRIGDPNVEIAKITDFLRDGDRANDALTLPNLRLLSSARYADLTRVKARTLTFLEALFTDDYAGAREILASLDEDPILLKPAISSHPSGRQARYDLRRIFNIAYSMKADQQLNVPQANPNQNQAGAVAQ